MDNWSPDDTQGLMKSISGYKLVILKGLKEKIVQNIAIGLDARCLVDCGLVHLVEVEIYDREMVDMVTNQADKKKVCYAVL